MHLRWNLVTDFIWRVNEKGRLSFITQALGEIFKK